MKIAVLSDVHDNIWNLRKALARMEGADAMLFCGDLCAPFSLKMLAEGFGGPIHVVRGNNDGDMFLLLRVASQHEHVTFYAEAMADVTLGDRRIAVVHYPHLAQAIAPSGKYDAVFFGHSHQAAKKWEERTLVLNPGEVMGRFGKATFALYDTEAHDADFVEF